MLYYKTFLHSSNRDPSVPLLQIQNDHVMMILQTKLQDHFEFGARDQKNPAMMNTKRSCKIT